MSKWNIQKKIEAVKWELVRTDLVLSAVLVFVMWHCPIKKKQQKNTHNKTLKFCNNPK